MQREPKNSDGPLGTPTNLNIQPQAVYHYNDILMHQSSPLML